MINEALKLSSLGLKVIPTDSQKRPLCKWKAYQDSQTTEDVKKLFSQNVEGMALLTGQGIEVIDVDCKYFLKDTHKVEHIFDVFLMILSYSYISQLW